MAIQKPTMQPIDWEPLMAALEANLSEIQQESQRIQEEIDKLIDTNEEIEKEIQRIFQNPS